MASELAENENYENEAVEDQNQSVKNEISQKSENSSHTKSRSGSVHSEKPLTITLQNTKTDNDVDILAEFYSHVWFAIFLELSVACNGLCTTRIHFS